MRKLSIFMIFLSFHARTESGEAWDEFETRGSSNYQIKRHVISSGGGTVESGDFKLSFTMGQALAKESFISGDYKITTGFWFQRSNDVVFKDGFD